jgi:predicted  nucleic acid-binding Zn-ribbon protein
MDNDLLFEISKIDSEILHLQKNITLKEKKKKLDILREEYNAIKKEYIQISEECSKNTSAADRMTKSLEGMSSDLEDQENKLYTSSSMKTIDVYQKNINKLKDDIKNNENIIYELINRIQELDLQKKGLLTASEKVKDEFNILKSEFNDEKADIDEKISQLTNNRCSIAEKVDAGIMNMYEAVKKNRGYGMAEVKGEICTGCGIGVPALIINEAALENKLVKCPNCERYIYIDKNNK